MYVDILSARNRFRQQRMKSDMFLNVTYNSMHVIVVSWILQVASMLVVICAASVSVRCGWELYIHHLLVWKVFWFAVVLWRAMRGVSHQITIWKAIIMHVTVCKLLLILIDLVQFRAHVSIGASSTHLTAEDVSTLRGSSWLSVSTDRVRATHISLLYLSNHLHLVWVIHNKFLAINGISSVDRSHTLASSSTTCITWPLEHDLALRRNCWYLVVIFLNWRQIYINSINFIRVSLIYFRRHDCLIIMWNHLAYRLGLFLLINVQTFR